MSQITFVLGAGASYSCGGPLMKDFLDVAHRLWRTGAVRERDEHFARVFKAIGSLQAVHSKSQLDLNNIESIFTCLEMSRTLGRLPGFEENEIPAVIQSLKELIVSTLETSIRFPCRGSTIFGTNDYSAFSDLLHHLTSDSSPKYTVSVITFNYDIALDLAVYRRGLGNNYGIIDSNSVGIPILKLHGSLNWASETANKSIRPLHFDSYFQKYRVQIPTTDLVQVPIGSQLKEYFSNTDVKVDAEPVIVPPTWNKVDHHKILEKVWKRAARELGETEYLYVMGYSLPDTDAFFRLLYGLGTVGSEPLKAIAVHDPDTSGAVEARFRSMLGPGAQSRFSYFNHNFSEVSRFIAATFPKS